MACKTAPAPVALCQICGDDLDSGKPKTNYQKTVDGHRPPFGTIIPSYRFDEDEAAVAAKKRCIPEKKKVPVEAYVSGCPASPLAVPLASCNAAPAKCPPAPSCPPKRPQPAPACAPAQSPAYDSSTACSGDSAPPPTKGACLPAGCPPPVKLMLCLPCPAPTCPPSPSPPPAPKPRDYQYRCESRELRMGNLYVCCDCLKRNGLQDDCRRTPCQGRPPCLTKPWPSCWPSGGCHGVDYSRENGTQRYNPCRTLRLDNTKCEPPCPPPCGDNMTVVVCPPPCP